jgi:hypothetical protein
MPQKRPSVSRNAVAGNWLEDCLLKTYWGLAPTCKERKLGPVRHSAGTAPALGQNAGADLPDWPHRALGEQSLWVVAVVRGNGIFAAETKPPKPFH